MARILEWFLPKERKFFSLLAIQAENVLKGAELLHFMVHNNIFDRETRKKIKEIESRGDDMTHEIIDMINKTFITPIDREDIHQLAVLMDDILDIAEETAILLHIYNISSVNEGILKLTDIGLECVKEVNKAVLHLDNFGDAKQHIISIHTIENKGDMEYNRCMSGLFRDSASAIDIIKLKDIYDHLESLIDKCESVANVIDNIVVKHA
jgi:hypothetical protein